MTPKPEPRVQHSKDPQQALDRVFGYAKVLAGEHIEIDRRLRAWRQDGYPSSTMGGFGGGPSILVDDDRVPVTTVEMAALFSRDDLAMMHMRYQTAVLKMLEYAVEAWAIREFTMADPEEAKKAKKRQAQIEKCANAHGCPDDAWGWKAGRCNACYQYRHRTGRDRTGREDAA